jgi:translation elongation factor EF-Tu-like GTPase
LLLRLDLVVLSPQEGGRRLGIHDGYRAAISFEDPAVAYDAFITVHERRGETLDVSAWMLTTQALNVITRGNALTFVEGRRMVARGHVRDIVIDNNDDAPAQLQRARRSRPYRA